MQILWDLFELFPKELGVCLNGFFTKGAKAQQQKDINVHKATNAFLYKNEHF